MFSKAPQTRWLVATVSCAVAAILLTASTASADLYKYQRKDGSILMTTQPQPGLKLLDHISDGGGSARAGTAPVGGKHKKSRIEALARRERAKNAGAGGPSTDRESHYDPIIREAAAVYQIPFAFIKGVIKVESNFHPLAVSRTGAMGLMQLMPGTARFLGVEDPYDPRQNIFGGTKLLRLLINRYNGDINLLLSAYNAGGGAVDRYNGIPYDQTREYVRRVYHWYKHYQTLGER